MAILVTGGAGYIGSHTCIELLENGYEVIVIDNLSNSKTTALERVREITNKDLKFIEADVRDDKALDEICKTYTIDSIIHFAGLKAVGESVAIPVEYYDNNLSATISLCKAMKRHNITKIVFSSSATVYKPGNLMPLSEDSPIGDCSNPYGWTKYMSEQILRDAAFANKEKNWSVLLLRYFNPIGAHSSSRIGEDPKGIPNNLVPYIAQTAIGRLSSLPVYGNDYDTPDGTGIRDYLHVADLAKGHVNAVKFADNHPGVEAVNLGTGKGISVLEMIKAFEKASGVKLPYEIKPRRPGDLPVCYSDAKKALDLLNWQAEKTLDDMCKDTWNWQKQNPEGYED